MIKTIISVGRFYHAIFPILGWSHVRNIGGGIDNTSKFVLLPDRHNNYGIVECPKEE